MNNKIEDWIKRAAVEARAINHSSHHTSVDSTHRAIEQAIAAHCPYGWRPMDQRPRARGTYLVRTIDWKRILPCVWSRISWDIEPTCDLLWLDDGRPADPDPDEEAFREAWAELQRMDMSGRTSQEIAWLGFIKGFLKGRKGRKSVEGERP